jgi:hypothetical protein
MSPLNLGLWIEKLGHDQTSDLKRSQQAKAMMSILLPSFQMDAMDIRASST